MSEIKTTENKIVTFLQSPPGMTSIVICIAIFLVIYLLFSSQTTRSTQHIAIPTPIPGIAQSHEYPTTNPALITASLSFVKHSSSIIVLLDTGQTTASGVQLMLSYDPKRFTNIAITPGDFFDNPTILQNSIDTTKGIITYAISVKPGDQQKKGQGSIANIYYTLATGNLTTFSFLPQTKVTSEGINASVLKQTTSISLP
jgi:hypothetical protein